ncbi:MAG: hypothetical protein ACI8VW_001575, partial [bacterium]
GKKEQKLHFKRWKKLDGYGSSVIQYADFDREYIESFVTDVHTRWLRARLRYALRIARQVKYFAKLTRVQGWSGFTRRVSRGARLLVEDAAQVGKNQSTQSSRMQVLRY